MKAHLNTIILAGAILLTALIFSNAFVNRNKASKTISVTVSEEKTSYQT
jgi:hypothetical protein